MLSAKNRLTKDKDFERVFKQGKSFSGQIIFFKILKNDLDFSRFGFIVSKKISKKSTVRNRIKRILRNIIRLKLKEIKTGFDVVIVAKPEILNKSYQEIEQVIDTIFKKAKLLE